MRGGGRDDQGGYLSIGVSIPHPLRHLPSIEMNRAILLMASIAGWEVLWWARRRSLRTSTYQTAQRRALELVRPLLVVGAPDQGTTSGYGCGDLTVDLAGSTCPRSITADITKQIPLDDSSVVVFVSCVLEYVDRLDPAIRELWRVSGGEMYIVRVEPWTLAAFFYPGAKRRLPSTLSIGNSIVSTSGRGRLR